MTNYFLNLPDQVSYTVFYIDEWKPDSGSGEIITRLASGRYPL